MKTVNYEENAYEKFEGENVWIQCIDGTNKKGKLIKVYQYEVLLEANLTPKKEEPQYGHILYMKHAIKAIREIKNDQKEG
ncbi:hypothetical protein KJJ36_13870 [Staphylococcus pseudoxylosus]|uniref:hypothetical protein n=1 Tax=Staphylococcus pseudoxylosus TaxID=2282419 RepID=UPI001F280572|nr:hypothetical protein [Staphylococcus pseudoxylosus]MCE5003454.1 hypothetical protein [Staphylococcus pseudoxylosus]